MTGTIVVHAEAPRIGRAGTLLVTIDGTPAGDVRQGHTARFPATAGTHRVRVHTKDRTSSNVITANVTDEQECLLRARGTGLGHTVFLVPLAGLVTPPLFTVLTVLLFAVLLQTVPGLLFRLRHDETATASADPDPGSGSDSAGDGESNSTGLWWESDPVLAKRYRKDSGS
ncbi:hypothetical protein ACGFX4_21125 [Kitasatospora sp. NPDC048365]|uniref:hypothetical protein n=1 Tax=Kitasatospora sp. NPDC048365 TaxID=3364050 RepID=UPI0037125341